MPVNPSVCGGCISCISGSLTMPLSPPSSLAIYPPSFTFAGCPSSVSACTPNQATPIVLTFSSPIWRQASGFACINLFETNTLDVLNFNENSIPNPSPVGSYTAIVDNRHNCAAWILRINFEGAFILYYSRRRTGAAINDQIGLYDLVFAFHFNSCPAPTGIDSTVTVA